MGYACARFYLLCLLFICVVAGSQLHGQEKISYHIYGNVFASDSPASRASIILQLKHENYMSYTFADSLGHFSFTGILNHADTALCTVRMMGYATDTISIAIIHSGSYPVYIFLQKRAYQLPEVVIHLETSNIDTFRYRIQTHLGKHDFYISDLINRIPGLSTDASGKIYYNNKPIKALLINGDPMLGASYEPFTLNIRATTFDTVELIKDYHDNRLEKGLSQSQDVAVNLVTHRPITGSASGLAATSLFRKYTAELHGFGMTQRLKLFTYGKLNNAGERYDIFSHTSTAPNPLDPQLLVPDWLIQPLPAGNPDVPYDRYVVNNRDAMAKGELSVQPAKSHRLNMEYTIGKQRQYIVKHDSSYFVVPGQQSWSLTNRYGFSRSESLQNFSLKWTHDPQKNYVGTYAFGFRQDVPAFDDRVLTSGYLYDTLTELIQNTSRQWNMETSQQLRLGKHLLTAGYTYTLQQLPEQQILHTTRLGKILDTTGQGRDYQQQLYTRFRHSLLRLGWTHGNRKHSYQAQVFYQDDDLSQKHVIDAGTSPPDALIQNTSRYTLRESGSSFSYKRSWRLFTELNLGGALSVADAFYLGKHLSFTLKQLMASYQWLPPLERKTKRKKIYVSNIGVSLNHREHLLSAEMLSPAFVLTAGYQLKNPAAEIFRIAENNFTFSTVIESTPLGITWSPAISISYHTHPVVWATMENPAYSFQQPVMGKDAFSYQLSSRLTKLLLTWNSKCFYNVQYAFQRNPYQLNELSYQQRFANFTQTFSYQWSPVLWFLMEASYTQQQLHTELQLPQQSVLFSQRSTVNKAFIKAAIDKSSWLKANLVYNYIHTASLPAFHTLDLYASYRLRKNITISVYGHNLLNHGVIAFRTLDPNRGSWTYYELVSRYVLISLQWGL